MLPVYTELWSYPWWEPVGWPYDSPVISHHTWRGVSCQDLNNLQSNVPSYFGFSAFYSNLLQCSLKEALIFVFSFLLRTDRCLFAGLLCIGVVSAAPSRKQEMHQQYTCFLWTLYCSKIFIFKVIRICKYLISFNLNDKRTGMQF